MTLSITVVDIGCCYAECHNYSNVVLSASMLSVVMLNFIMLNVVARSLYEH